MRAALVTRFDAPPTCQEVAAPQPADEDELVVDVLAAGLHPRVRSQADGSHYTSTDELPLVPGVDGVGRGPDGLLRYFVLPDTTLGSMAEQTVVDVRRSIVLPADSDPVLVAAAMNPAMSSWVALRRRTSFQPGQQVLVLGATGSSGRMAVRIARLFGAGRVIGAGRDPERLAGLTGLGATDTVRLGTATTEEELRRLCSDVDVVIDYLWGEPTAQAMVALVTHRTDPGALLTWVEVGSVAGRSAPIPSAALRAARLQIVGSGQGSVAPRDYAAEISSLAEAVCNGTFELATRVVPLADVEQAWTGPATDGARVVIVP